MITAPPPPVAFPWVNPRLIKDALTASTCRRINDCLQQARTTANPDIDASQTDQMVRADKPDTNPLLPTKHLLLVLPELAAPA
jgi:hypothetical protein